MPHRKRGFMLYVRLSDQELATLNAVCAELDLDMSKVVRLLVEHEAVWLGCKLEEVEDGA